MNPSDLDIWGDLKAADVVIIDEAAGNARERIPVTVDEAVAFFRCETLAASLRGSLCASNWRAAEDGATTRPSCRGCAAGCARASLLASVGQLPMPAQMLVDPVRAVAKCPTCGMVRSAKAHTPGACERLAAAMAAAASPRAAQERAATRAAIKARESAEAERIRHRRQVREAREARERMREEERAKLRRAADEARAAKLAAKTAKAAEKAQARAKAKADELVQKARRDAERRTARELRPSSKRVHAPKAGTCIRGGGCSRNATAATGGRFCTRCYVGAREAIEKRFGRTPGDAEITTMLLDPFWTPHAPVDWTSADWTQSNVKIAKSLGVAVNAVLHQRKIRGIAPNRASKRVDWSKFDHLLGTMTDREIGVLAGCSHNAVSIHRAQLGIPKKPDPRVVRHTIDWDSLPLGVESDGEIARKLGVMKSTVRVARVERGIPPCGKLGPTASDVGVDWSKVDMTTMTVEQIAEKYGVSRNTVTRRRKALGIHRRKTQPEVIDWSTARFGEQSDSEIADMLGVGIKAVNRARRRRGIAPVSIRSNIVRGIDWSMVDFSISDAINASVIGCDARIVTQERKRRGILRDPNERRAQQAKAPAVDIETVRAQYADMLKRFEDRKAARAAAKEHRASQKSARIAAMQAKGRDLSPDASPRRGIDWDAQPLGTMPDVELAKMLGVSQSTVWRARDDRGILPFRFDSAEAAP